MEVSKKQMPVKVEFQGAVLEGALLGEKSLVALKPIVDGMGMEWSRQLKKAKGHPVIGPTMGEMYMVGEDGKSRPMAVIPLDKVPFFLALINSDKVSPALRDKVIRYQMDVADVLAKAFLKGKGELQDWQGTRREAAGRYSVMSEILLESRADLGKETKPHHFMNEALMVNETLTGVRKGLDRENLSSLDLRLLSRLEAKNSVLIGRDYPYQYRKAILARFVAEERAKLTTKLEA